ncbi:MAG: glycoside hydrolase family 13 domain protein [Gemmatimonadetes bacterium]|nr:glycoside hydrolase family 13 domain protein [Gemmatimonadota bacterium]
MAERAERDPVIERVVHEMRATSPSSDATIARVVAAAVQAREMGVLEEAEDVPVRVRTPRRLVRWRVAGWIAAAASLTGFAVGASITAWRDRAVRVVAPVEGQSVAVASMAAPTGAPTGAPSAALASNSAAEDARVVTQFVLARPGAASVALVGDFNAWDKAATPLAQEPGSGVWSVALPLVPGRHVYAFLVNGAEWVVDPRAPKANDPDFGVAGSAVVVGRP